MVAKFVGFISAVVALPVVGELPIPVEDTYGKLAQGTVQMVLAVVVIFLALALVQIYKLHRKDMLASRDELKEENKVVQKLLSDNATVITQMKDSNRELREAIQDLTGMIRTNGHMHHRASDE